MDKIVIYGTCNKEKIKSQYENQLEIDFNISCNNFEICNKYSAVFFTGEYEETELNKWIGNEHLRIALSEKALFEEINFFLGIPKPVEIERKFLIEYPNIEFLNSLKNCNFVEISQCYANENGHNFRVRKRGKDEENIYIRTEKIRITEIKRIEIEKRISKEDYEKTIKGNKVLSKTRYLFLYKNQYFELDVFPFWNNKALLEIELKSETDEFELPNFISVIKEVTNDKRYRNSSIATIYGTLSN